MRRSLPEPAEEPSRTERVRETDSLHGNRAEIRSSSTFLRRIVSSMFMRVDLKCAHHVRPPLRRVHKGSAIGQR